MTQQVLSRAQRNDIFQWIRKLDLDPVDFDWSTGHVGRPPHVQEMLRHRPTGAFMTIAEWTGGGHWITWWPNQAGAKSSDGCKHWQYALEVIAGWLQSVKVDHEAPDLWGELQKQRIITQQAASSEYEKPFSSAELKLLREKLADVEHFIETTQPLEETEKKEVRRRFQYLLDAAEKGARKIDWLNLFAGQIMGMVVAGIIDAKFYGPLMSHAATALNALFQFGLKLLN